MPVALALPLDDPAAVLAHWQALDTAGIGTARPDYPPHLTLVVCAAAPAALPRLMLGNGELLLASIGTFTRPSGVVFAAPVPTGALLALHATLATACDGVDPHYRPGAWVPHVTLAAGVTDLAAAIAALDFVPLRARVSRLELVAFPPPRVLSTCPLMTED